MYSLHVLLWSEVITWRQQWKKLGFSTSSVTLSEPPQLQSGKLHLELIHSNKLFQLNKHRMLVLVSRSTRRYSSWYSVYRKAGGQQHRFTVRGALFLEFKPLLVSCATLRNSSVPSAIHFFVYLRQSLSSLENYCRDEMRELKKHSFNTHTTFCLVECQLKFSSSTLYVPQIVPTSRIRKDNYDTGSNVMVEKCFVFYPSIFLKPIRRICMFLLL